MIRSRTVMGAGAAVIVLFVCLFLIDVPRLTPVVPETQDAVFVIDEPERQEFFYGVFDGMPHTYAFDVRTPTRIVVQLMMPETADSPDSVSAIIVRMPEGKGRVEEVTRLRAADTTWSTARIATGDVLRHGPSFDAMLEPGAYRLEVHTSDNTERYILRIGTDTKGGNYFSFITRLVGFKEFLGDPVVFVVLSPFVFIPFSVCLCAVIVWRMRRTR